VSTVLLLGEMSFISVLVFFRWAFIVLRFLISPESGMGDLFIIIDHWSSEMVDGEVFFISIHSLLASFPFGFG